MKLNLTKNFALKYTKKFQKHVKTSGEFRFVFCLEKKIVVIM